MDDMKNMDAETKDVHPERADGLRTKNQKVLEFIKRHGAEITFGVGCLALTVICVKQGGTIASLRKQLEKKEALLRAKDWRISDLIELSAEKDRCHLKLASAALRDGCSEGGRALADYRHYLRGQL